MKHSAIIKKLMMSALLTLSVGADASAQWATAQSAIYACGHIRRNRETAIDNLRNSGYTTAIIFNVNVEVDGSLTTDFTWSSQQAAESGGIICKDGEYVFDAYQPHYVSDIKRLLERPTSIRRIEICIGGWGNGSYGSVRKLVEQYGTGPETVLYRNFKALKEVLPEVVAINNDQEQDYDLASATAFHLMLAEIGYKTTIAPYTNREYWRQLVENLNEAVPGTVDLVYLQTYGGGAGNNPDDWRVFGDISMWAGYDCEATPDLDAMDRMFVRARDVFHMHGGFIWNYNGENCNLNQWGSAINRIFRYYDAGSVVTVFSERNYEGYGVVLAPGAYAMADLAYYGITADDIESLIAVEGAVVTAYTTPDMTGAGIELSGENPDLGPELNNKIRSMVITADGYDGIEDTSVADAVPAEPEVYNLAGIRVDTGRSLSELPHGIYVVKRGGHTVKVAI